MFIAKYAQNRHALSVYSTALYSAYLRHHPAATITILLILCRCKKKVGISPESSRGNFLLFVVLPWLLPRSFAKAFSCQLFGWGEGNFFWVFFSAICISQLLDVGEYARERERETLLKIPAAKLFSISFSLSLFSLLSPCTRLQFPKIFFSFLVQNGVGAKRYFLANLIL